MRGFAESGWELGVGSWVDWDLASKIKQRRAPLSLGRGAGGEVLITGN